MGGYKFFLITPPIMSAEKLAANLARHVKLRELRVFISVAEHGSLRRAAESLHVTQPAVTMTIAELESVLGVRLLDRTPQGITLTPHGHNFLKRAEAIFGELRLAAEEVQSISDGAEGSLHLGSVPMPASGVIPAALALMHSRFPRVFISAMEGNEATLAEALRSRRIDLFLARRPLSQRNDGLTYEMLYEDPLCIVASPTHPMSQERKIRFADLANQQWILPPQGTGFHDHIRRVLTELGSEVPKRAIETLSIPIMYGMLASGEYLAFATRSQYRFTAMRPLLRQLTVELPEIAAPICSVTLEGRHLTATGMRFLECLRDLLNSSE